MITKTEQFVFEYLQKRAGKWISPTEIGNAYKSGYHSSWASPKCLKLVKIGAIERNEDGHYAYALSVPYRKI